VNKALINDMTGKLATDSELPQVLQAALRASQTFKPRQWAMRHTGYRNAWCVLNSRLAGLAAERGESYEMPIAMTRSSPAATYVDDADRERLQSEYDQLKRLLRSRTDVSASWEA